METGDAARAVGRGAGHQRVEVGDAAVGDPGLHAVDRVAGGAGGAGRAAVPGNRPGRQRGGVGPRLRLRQAVRAQPLAAQHLGKQRGALLGGAVGGHREARQRVDRQAETDGQPAGRELLDHLQVDLVRLRRPAVLLGVGQAEQPRAAERGEHLPREAPGGLVGRGPGRDLLADQVADQVQQVMGVAGRQNALNGHLGPSSVETPPQGSRGGAPACSRSPARSPGADDERVAGITGHPDSGTRRASAATRPSPCP